MPRLLALVLAVIGWLAPASSASAQDWPVRPVKIIIPLGPGGGGDVFTRLMAEELQKRLGQPFMLNVELTNLVRGPFRITRHGVPGKEPRRYNALGSRAATAKPNARAKISACCRSGFSNSTTTLLNQTLDWAEPAPPPRAQ